jgi:hypothetical protein
LTYHNKLGALLGLGDRAIGCPSQPGLLRLPPQGTDRVPRKLYAKTVAAETFHRKLLEKSLIWATFFYPDSLKSVPEIFEISLAF